MFSLLKVNLKLVELKFGPTITCIGQLGRKGEKAPADQINPLIVPWQTLLPDPGLFNLLSWHTRLSEFTGRDDELSQLNDWAKSEHPIRVNFVVGEGGTGKSRLGAEFAELMQKEGWSAGFVNLRKPVNIPISEDGTLLIIDYPEEYTQRVVELLSDLTHIEQKHRLRILFLTRQSPEYWADFVSAANAANVVDNSPIALKRLNASDSKTIYDSTVKKSGEILGNTTEDGLSPSPIPEEAMEAWIKLAPENHRSLFIMAAAVHSAEFPDKQVVEFSGRDIVNSLVQRENDRLIRLAESNGFKNKDALILLLAMAAIAGELTLQEIETLKDNHQDFIGLKTQDYFANVIRATGILTNDCLVPSAPDIVAASLTVQIFSKYKSEAPDLIWFALEKNIDEGLDGINRLCYDTISVLKIRNYILVDSINTKIVNNFTLCEKLRMHFTEDVQTYFISHISITMFKTLIISCEDMLLKIRYLNNLSYCLSLVQNLDEAYNTIAKACQLCRRFIKEDPEKYNPELATCLLNKSNRLSDYGRNNESLDNLREAIAIFEKLIDYDRVKYLPKLAQCENNLSLLLSDIGEIDKSLEIIKTVVKTYKSLVSSDPQKYFPHLAMSYDNCGVQFSKIGQNEKALEMTREAIRIRRKLCETNSAKYESSLLASMQNYSTRLHESGKIREALEVSKESVIICRRLCELNPQKYEPSLALGLNNLSNLYRILENPKNALKAITKAVELYDRLSRKKPKKYEPFLALSLCNLSQDYLHNDNVNMANSSIKKALDIYDTFTKQHPAKYEPEYARCLGCYSMVLYNIKDYAGAISILRKALDKIKPYANKYPDSSHAKLQESMKRDINIIKKKL